MLRDLLILLASLTGVCGLAHKASEICRPPDPRFPDLAECRTSFGIPFVSSCVGMAKKRTKADKLQRQTEQLEKRVERRPDEIEKKKTAREAGHQE